MRPPVRSAQTRRRGLIFATATWALMLALALIGGPGYVIATFVLGLLLAACWWADLT